MIKLNIDKEITRWESRNNSSLRNIGGRVITTYQAEEEMTISIYTVIFIFAVEISGIVLVLCNDPGETLFILGVIFSIMFGLLIIPTLYLLFLGKAKVRYTS